MDIKDALTLALATIGAVLGVFNAWRNWIKDRVRVRLDVSDGFFGAQDHMILNVRNLSDFPITITAVGFDLLGGDNVMQIPLPHFTRSETLPVRLESRTACAVATNQAKHPHPLTGLRCAWIKTACGLKITGGKRYFDLKRVAAAAQHPPGVK
jgi:hypothetical protein